MKTTNNGTQDTEARPMTLQERALAELQEERELAEQRHREYEENQRRQALDSFGWRLRNSFGIFDFDINGVPDPPPDTIVEIDGVTLRYTQTSGNSARDGYVSMAVECPDCGKPDAWQTVDDLHDIGRVLSGERWGYSGPPVCEACWQAREDAASEAVIEARKEREAAAAEPPAPDLLERVERLELTVAEINAALENVYFSSTRKVEGSY